MKSCFEEYGLMVIEMCAGTAAFGVLAMEWNRISGIVCEMFNAFVGG